MWELWAQNWPHGHVVVQIKCGKQLLAGVENCPLGSANVASESRGLRTGQNCQLMWPNYI